MTRHLLHNLAHVHARALASLLVATGLTACDGSTTPAASPSPGAAPAPRYQEITETSGIDFVHDAGLDDSYFMPQILGAGAALFDFDGDGDLDVYLVNGAYHGDPGPGPRNVLYRQDDGPRFTDVTDEAGVGDGGFGMGVAVGDYDNDGDPDLYLTNYGPDSLYRNDGNGTFTDVTADAGIDTDRWGSSAAFLDYDRDGWLDLYVVNYVHYPEPKVCADDAGRPEYCGPTASPGVPDLLLHNEGDGTFRDVSDASGIASVAGKGLGVICEDFTGDGLVDIYVANDGEANQLWVNTADGSFDESAMILGAALNMFAATEASMGVTAADVDDDGDLDLFMTHLVRESNTLYRNDGTGSFDDVTAAAGLGAPSRRYTGFGTAFLDFDNDGAMDLAIANGRVTRAGSRRPDQDPLAPYAEPNLLFRNEGDGRFTDTSAGAGTFCSTAEVSRGLAVGDLDDDGGVDLLVTNCHGPARLYRNTTPNRGHWLIVRAVDPTLQRDAYGARVIVTAGGRQRHRTINAGYSYASSCDPRAHFGLGEAAAADSIEIRWPDGLVETFPPVPADQVLTLERGTGRE
ncbi:MAG: hypothetical protein GY715_16300 [Planctomycetes bacterium]|nr:hypothetical protein [Planctomycetota bacterium]